jgi:hypothetical protein
VEGRWYEKFCILIVKNINTVLLSNHIQGDA